MIFKLNSEQQMLQDSVRRFVEKAYSFEVRNALLKDRAAAAHWDTFAANGWLAAALPDDFGGLGGTVIDTVVIAQELGKGLVLEPYLGCAVLAAQTFSAAATPAQKTARLPLLCEGTERFALAFVEPNSGSRLNVVTTKAIMREDGYLLEGRKTLVLGARGASHYLVSARVASPEGAGDGISLFLVDARRAGITHHAMLLHDGSEASELVFDGVLLGGDALVGEAGRGLDAIEHGLSHAVATLCGELIGGMERAIGMTADYLKIRKQFGVPIASFQALQHRMAEMAADLELARSMLYALLYSLENDDAAGRRKVVSQAKALIGRIAKSVCAQAIQLHGGIGMTEECAVGHYYKRAIVADVLFGSSDEHEGRLMAVAESNP